MFLLLLCLGTASVKAQVRIGGNAPPNPAAALDLNADDSATPAGNKGALALPRVSLASTTAQINGATPITGMLVYNTNATLGVGIYFWNGTKWLLLSSVPSTNTRPYSLMMIVDTILTLPAIAANSYTTVALPVTYNDFCPTAILGGYGMQIVCYDKYVAIFETRLNAATTTGGIWVKCYRPVPL